VQRIGEALVASVVWIGTGDVVRFALVKIARDVFIGGLGKQVICDAHLHVVRLARENGDGLVLCLPAEFGDRAVVAAAIRNTGNA
jgi:hypothetical protein